MSQPDPPQGNGQVIAAAAIGLALIAVEARVRQEVDDDIQALYQGLAAAAVLAASTAPGTLLTGLALISLASFHTATVKLFDTARTNVADTIESGYAAGAQVALTKARTELGTSNVPNVLPELGNTIDTILADVDTMTGHAKSDFQNTVQQGFDPANPAGLNPLILGNASSLRNRAQAAAGTAVHSGGNDALVAIYSNYQLNTGQPGLMKRWITTSATPCGMCEALNGTMVGINAEFDHNATTNDKDYRRVWRNLAAPPRHPHCRCQIELVQT